MILFNVPRNNTTNIFAQCSVTFTQQDDYCGMCNGLINTIPTGQPPFSFSWSTGDTTQNVSGLCAGNYFLTMSDSNGCSVSEIVSVSAGGELPPFTSGTNATCNGCCNGIGNVTVSGGFPPYTYSWSMGQTTSNVTGLCAGNYTVSVTDSMGCITVLLLTITEPPLGLHDTYSEKGYNVTLIFLQDEMILIILGENKNGWDEILISDIYGKNVLQYPCLSGRQTTTNNSITISAKTLANGIYCLSLYHDNNFVAAQKFVIAR